MLFIVLNHHCIYSNFVSSSRLFFESNSIYNLVHATHSRAHQRRTIHRNHLSNRYEDAHDLLHHFRTNYAYDGINKSPIIRKFVPKRKKKERRRRQDGKKKEGGENISVIYKPHPPIVDDTRGPTPFEG